MVLAAADIPRDERVGGTLDIEDGTFGGTGRVEGEVCFRASTERGAGCLERAVNGVGGSAQGAFDIDDAGRGGKVGERVAEVRAGGERAATNGKAPVEVRPGAEARRAGETEAVAPAQVLAREYADPREMGVKGFPAPACASVTYLPKTGLSAAARTSPGAGARTGVPAGVPMSTPVWPPACSGISREPKKEVMAPLSGSPVKVAAPAMAGPNAMSVMCGRVTHRGVRSNGRLAQTGVVYSGTPP
ncbi:MAG: hypothetical protein M5U18_11680 [Dehalococcoidia bacterium]|nr:hypothetical protein [Dehalococcoidia bacterium]